MSHRHEGLAERWKPVEAAEPTHSSIEIIKNNIDKNHVADSDYDHSTEKTMDGREQPRSEKRSRDSDQSTSHGRKKRRGYETSSHRRGHSSRHGSSRHHSDNRRRDGDRSRRESDDSYHGRHESGDSYYGRGGYEFYDDHVDADWRCLECGLWNFYDDYSCHRCRGRGPSPTRSGDDEPIRRKNSKGSDSDTMDEFGRSSHKSKATDTEWPPNFASNSSVYVLDSRCGMFYEKDSDFFYDPKSKLYYGNKKSCYYRFDESQSPPFIQVETPAEAMGPPGGTEDCSLPVVQSLAPSAAVEGPPRMAIAINLKTKAIKDSKKRDKKKSVSTVGDVGEEKPKNQIQQGQEPRVHKQHVENIEKWTERGRELREEVQGLAKVATTKEVNITAAGSVVGITDKVVKTSKGEPMCVLCKRKFPNVDKLRQHEQLSALHKDNLLKKAAADSASELKKASQYRDRAQERRVMYGPEASSVVTLLRAEVLEVSHQAEVVSPEDSLGDSNIGNQMLQKLGWKSGSSLGRTSSGNSEGGQKRSMEASLMQDWKRIESLASGGKSSNGIS